jgi:protoheme IX farnesyltransferase
MSSRTSGAAALPAGHLSAAPRLWQLLSDYVQLTKPKVQSLLLLTTISTMYVAGDPSPALVALTCLGGYLSAGGAGAVNHFFDRDIDALMGRTSDRPVPSGRIAPHTALAFGCTLATLSVIELSVAVNVLAAGLSFAGFIGYVGVYTMWLKRRTPQNIVIGGAAGAVPPLVGWAAVRGSVSGTAVVLFFIVFFWTPPHFWSLSLLMRGEYERVGVPMLPVVAGEKETRRQILLYAVLLYMVTQLPFCAGAFGLFYLGVSMALGLGFIGGAIWLYRAPGARGPSPKGAWRGALAAGTDATGAVSAADAAVARRRALKLYLYSLAYLALLFVAMVADVKL